MTYKYCAPEDEKEIIELYRSGQYSFQQIADMKALSKSTVINIVKSYPYTKGKEGVYSRLQIDSANKLEEVIEVEEQLAHKAWVRGSYLAYGLHSQRWLDLIEISPKSDRLYELTKQKRLKTEHAAWEALANRRFSEFGYCSELWEVFTDIIGDNAKSPWHELINRGKARRHSLKFSICNDREENG